MNFARLLRSVIPDKDFVGRYGGDEFMAVIYHTSKKWRFRRFDTVIG